jgi:integrase
MESAWRELRARPTRQSTPKREPHERGEANPVDRMSPARVKAEWAMFDIAAGMWVMPRHHTKQRKEHVVRLSGAACALLQGLREQAPEAARYVFPGVRDDDGTSAHAGSCGIFWHPLRERAGIHGVHLHDLRHTFEITSSRAAS